MGKPVLPEGRREEVVALLTRLMANPDLLDAYAAELRAQRERLGPAAEQRLLGMAGPDIPGEEILHHGFAGLSDEVLADLAICPEALEALDQVHFRGEQAPGSWFFDALRRENAARPDTAERAKRADQVFAELRAPHDPPRRAANRLRHRAKGTLSRVRLE
jgi:hypothetical protein